MKRPLIQTAFCVAKTNKRLIKLWLVNIPQAAHSEDSSLRSGAPLYQCPKEEQLPVVVDSVIFQYNGKSSTLTSSTAHDIR